MSDPTSPAHYKDHPAGVECIDVIRYLPCPIANVVKYLWRWEKKDGVQDLEKALVYLEWVDPLSVEQYRSLPAASPTEDNIRTAVRNIKRHHDPEARVREMAMNASPAPSSLFEDPLYRFLKWLDQKCEFWENFYATRTIIREKITAAHAAEQEAN